MRFVVGLLACVGGVSLALGDDPPAAPAVIAPAAAAAPSAAAAAATPPSAANSTTTAAAAAKPNVDRDIQHFTQEGFKPEMRHGQELYCRRETALGSRLTPVKTCGTIGELKAMEQRTRDDLQQAQQRQTSSPQGPGAMGGH
jgi:hypothetical protein